MINREDMLELTRRMTVKRNLLDRVAGAYYDEEGYVDGTFNVHYLKLSGPEQAHNLTLAKAVPFAATNEKLKEYPFPGKSAQSTEIWKLLSVLNSCGLKNDAMLEVLYELIGEALAEEGNRSEPPSGGSGPSAQNGSSASPGGCAFFLFHGNYDVPLKASDKERLHESEEVYSFLIGVLCPLEGEYEPGKPEWGFLFPAFTDRSSDAAHIEIFEADPGRPHTKLREFLLRS